MKCKNCGKHKKSHIKSTVGSGKQSKTVLWCYALDLVKPEDKEYFMRYETTHKTTKKKETQSD